MNEIERIIAHCNKQMDRWNVDNPIYKEHEATRRYLQEYRHLLQSQAERDKMQCENCKHEPKNPTSKTLPCSMCSVAYASYFEPKENENG